MQRRETGSSENVFRYLRRTELEVETIPVTLKRVYQPYLQIIKSTRRFMDEGERQFPIGDVMYDVRKYKSENRDGFVFYSESRDAKGVQEKKTVDLKTDRNYVGVETAEVVSDKVDEEGRILSKIWTRIDLSRGTYVEQQVEPIPMESQVKSYNKQTFILNTRDSTLARLVWSKNGEELPVIEIISTGETIRETIFLHSEQIRTDLRTGERLIKRPEGTIRFPRPDEFVAQAIRKVVNLEPITFSLK